MRALVHELEIIRYPQTDGLCMFFDTIDYRTAHFHPEWEILLVLENPLLIHTAGEEMTLSRRNDAFARRDGPVQSVAGP